MEDIEGLKNKIRQFIIETFMFGKGNLNDNQLLLDSGIVDSLGLIKVLAFVEKTFCISFDRSEIVIEKFNSINALVKTIVDKRG